MVYLLLAFSLVLGLGCPFEAKAATQVYFSPKDQVADRLVELIAKEKESIRIAIYCLTHRGIATALIQAKKRGVSVEMIVDPFSVKVRTPLARLAKAGIPIYVWDPIQTPEEQAKRPRSPLMHDKFCIFGKKNVWTGSFNFTNEAHRANQENVVILDEVNVVAAFQEQFNRIKKEGCRPYTEFMADKKKSK